MKIYLHSGLMLLGFCLMLSGFAAARFLRARRNWLRIHRTLGTAGASSILLGFIAAFLMIALFGGKHFAVFHSLLGISAVMMSVLTPVLGQLQFTLKSRAKVIRTWHRRSGAITLVLIALAIISGIMRAGILPVNLHF